MSRIALATLTGAAAFAAAGLASGALLDTDGGAAGALEWVLRTLVVAAAAVAIAGASVLVLRLRRHVPGPRPIGWVVAAAAWVAFAWFVAVPAAYAVYLTHLPARKAVADANLGAPKQAVTLTGADGVHIRGWYVPSRNGAAVIALHGTGGSRASMVPHARMLVRQGYGVLALDLRGHGASDGRSTSVPWLLDDDMDAAVRWLARRDDVHGGRIGMLGVSLGGEVAVQTAARLHAIRAIVAEGVTGGAPADLRAAGADPASIGQIGALFGFTQLLAASRPPADDGELIARIAPRPVLLISSGRSTEAAANRAFVRRGSAGLELWNLPTSPHGSALHTAPGAYERHVVGFLDRALLG